MHRPAWSANEYVFFTRPGLFVSCFLTSVYPARVVPVFISELEHPRFKEFDLSSLRTGIMGTPSLPPEPSTCT